MLLQQESRLISKIRKKRSFKYGFSSLLGATLAVSAGCGKSQSPIVSSENQRLSINSNSAIPATSAIQISDPDGNPIAGAKILIGSRENVPFPGNLLTTDANGQIAIPRGWTDAQPVTVDANGFVRVTYFNRTPGALAINLRRQNPDSRIELKGETTDFEDLSNDGFLDIGLVFPALSRQQIALIQTSSLISPETDSMTVFGSNVDVPSNVSFPYQEESYLFFNVTFNKPIYRTYFNEARTWRMVAAHARFPFKDVAGPLKDGKPLLDVINNFEFKSASVKDIPIKSSSTSFDISVAEVPFVPAATVVAPKFDRKYMMLSVALAPNGSLFYPSDVKRFESREKRTLTMPKNATSGMVVSALRRPDAPTVGAASEELSAVVTPSNQSQSFDFLPVVRAPEIRSGTLVMYPPTQIAGVEPTMTYAVLSKVGTVQGTSMKLENKSTVGTLR
jgi:hypothetical protein